MLLIIHGAQWKGRLAVYHFEFRFCRRANSIFVFDFPRASPCIHFVPRLLSLTSSSINAFLARCTNKRNVENAKENASNRRARLHHFAQAESIGKTANRRARRPKFRQPARFQSLC